MATGNNGLIRDEMSERIIEVAEKMVTEKGVGDITVRKILYELGITNRVFYNRFHNIEEVLHIVYNRTVLKIRQSILPKLDPERDFFEQVTDIVVNTLLMSYDNKMQFNYYVFESDSLSQSNFEWWTGQIQKLILYAKERGLIRDVDPKRLSYSIWCFCRGYNADAVGRRIPREEAEKNFRYGFGYFLDGLKQ